MHTGRIQNMDPQSMDHSMDPFMDPVNGVPLWNHKWNLIHNFIIIKIMGNSYYTQSCSNFS